MRKLFIFLLLSFFGVSVLADIQCPIVIYCPTMNSQDCLIPPGWVYWMSSQNIRGSSLTPTENTLKFHTANIMNQTGSLADCDYVASNSNQQPMSVRIRSKADYLKPNVQTEGNKWVMGPSNG